MHFCNRHIDHIVYCVPNLEEAILWFENQTGIRPKIGGRHLEQGTKNALVHLGDKCYFEILATDNKNTKISENRWMGIDLITQPKITRWCLNSVDLIKDKSIVQEYNPKMGMIHTGKRETNLGDLLSWQMILPLSNPEVEVIPFMIDWSGSECHPTDTLPKGCNLIDVELYLDANDSDQKKCLNSLIGNIGLHTGKKTKISVTISGPKGILKI